MKKKLTGYVLLSLAVLIVLGALLLVKTSLKITEQEQKQPNMAKASFGNDNYTMIKADTFVKLAVEKYASNVTIDRKGDVLLMNVKSVSAQDFYNNNQQLLQLKLRDYGFEFSNDQNDGNLLVKFKIESNAVAVPNDVLIKMLEK